MNMVFNVAGQDGISHGVVIKEEQVSGNMMFNMGGDCRYNMEGTVGRVQMVSIPWTWCLTLPDKMGSHMAWLLRKNRLA